MSDSDLVNSFVEATSGMTQEDAAALIGVSQRTISSWRGGARPRLRGDTREMLQKFLEDGGQATSARVELAADYETDAVAEWLRDFERTVRLAGGKTDLDEEERRKLQRDIINVMIDARKARGADVPAALYEMLGRVDRNEL